MLKDLKSIKGLTRSQLTESIKKQLKEIGLNPMQNGDPNAQQVQPEPIVKPEPPEVKPNLIDDEVGYIFVVKMPIEGAEVSHIVEECSGMDFNEKIQTGEIQRTGISAICKSSASANRKAGKLLQEFHKNLIGTRKTELKELKTKKQYWETRIAATEERYSGEQFIDEAQKKQMGKIRKGLKSLDSRILELENQLRATKEEKEVEK